MSLGAKPTQATASGPAPPPTGDAPTAWGMPGHTPGPGAYAGLWALAPALTVAVFLLPVLAGLLGTLAPAFGWLPAIGGRQWTLAPWQALWQQPGIGTAVRLSLTSGLLSTALALGLSCALWAWLPQHPGGRRMLRLVPPLLALPHVAVAVGLAFLIAPGGWLVRLLSPWLTGWDRPPTDLITDHDPHGLAMVLGLLVKELPFLLLMTGAALHQVPVAALLRGGAALGQAPASAWFKLVLPRLYPQLRLPVYAVLAYAMSSVEVAWVLGPGDPPPLALMATRWLTDPDLQSQFVAAAAALLQGALVLAALLAWWLAEGLVARAGRAWCQHGARQGWADALTPLGAWLAIGSLVTGLATWALMALWSVAQAWRFPSLWPQAWTLDRWATIDDSLLAALAHTAGLAAASATLSLLLVVACLEHETRRGRNAAPRTLWLVYAPLLVPQLAFLFGFQVLLVALGLDGKWLAVAWAHTVFVLPYAFLTLVDPWRALDSRFARAAAALGASPWRVLWRVRLPLLAPAIAQTLAVGIAVSVGLYLPTLFAGAGRIATLTTEAVTLSAGADRRVLGVYSVLQAALPWLAFAAAWGLPRWWRRRGFGRGA